MDNSDDENILDVVPHLIERQQDPQQLVFLLQLS